MDNENKDEEDKKEDKESKLSKIMNGVYEVVVAILLIAFVLFSGWIGLSDGSNTEDSMNTNEGYTGKVHTVTQSAVATKDSESIRNVASEGEYYVLEIQTLNSRDELYVILCSIVNGKPDFKARSIINIDKEPELSRWHTLLVGDTIKYYGNLKFDLVQSTDKIN